MDQRQSKRAVCEMCHCRCRVLVYTEGGRLARIEEDRSHPAATMIFPPTRACLRLRAAQEWMYHPERVNFPLKRAGERGEGKWKRISWDAAFDELAERLGATRESYGAEAVGVAVGTGRTREHFISRFFNLFGSPNYVGQGEVCFTPTIETETAMFGWPLRKWAYSPPGKGAPDQRVAKCLLLIGFDPSQSQMRAWKQVRDARESGVKVIVIDPRRTATAARADLWLQLKPGTDTAVLLSMINVVIGERLYDEEFVGRWCYGFDKVVERVRDYSPEKIAGISWLPAERIREAARMFATNRPSVATVGMGVEHQQASIETIQAKNILSAIVGNIDLEGGEYLSGPGKFIAESEMELSEMLPREQRRKQLGGHRFRFVGWEGYELTQSKVKKVWGKGCSISLRAASAHAPTMYRAILSGEPYPVKAVITLGANPLVTQANTKLVYKALKSLELYTVWDYWMTPSAEIADYVLPVASWLERPCLHAQSGRDCRLLGGEQALPSRVPGEYDHKTDYEILCGLAVRLGQEEHWPWDTLEETYDYQLKPMGLSFKEFMDQGGYSNPPNQYKKYEKMGFATPTGKVELYSTIFEKLGYDPLPAYHESFENPISQPQLAQEYPYILINGGRFQPMYHSEHRNIDSLRRRHPHPLVQINPKTARELDIENGDWVWVETPRGRIRMKCQYFDGIEPRVVHAEHGWWFPELPGEEPWLHGVWESNVNVLTDDDPDHCNALGGGWPLKTALCKLYKVQTY